MIEARKVANKIESEREKAIAYDNIVPMMEEIITTSTSWNSSSTIRCGRCLNIASYC